MDADSVEGNLVNLLTEEIYPARIEMKHGLITDIVRLNRKFSRYIVPGYIDAHIHIESSMLVPSRFAEAVIPHGTTSVVTDPHEIANVVGMEGIDFMTSCKGPLNIFFTAPSCVPATPFETAGATLGPREISRLLKRKEFVALGEMMNFPGVVQGQKDVMAKIKAAKEAGKPIDGHAPLLRGTDLSKYISAGISTDHECSSLEEAEEKMRKGMIIQIREGSASKNMEALIDIAKLGDVMLVSDDKHPYDLRKGHVDLMLKKAVSLGMDPIKALRAVSVVPAEHYNLNTGLIAPGYQADFLVLKGLKHFTPDEVYIRGRMVSKGGKSLFSIEAEKRIEVMNLLDMEQKDILIAHSGKSAAVHVIVAEDGELLTGEELATLPAKDGFIRSDPDNDILHIAVADRYGKGNIGRGFIKGFGLEKGAIATSVAHDSHNVISVGVDAKSMLKAMNAVKEMKGGLVAYDGKKMEHLALPVAGLMTDAPLEEVAAAEKRVYAMAHRMGSGLNSPFMTLSFMALLVIPELKLSDKGLFRTSTFSFVPVVVE